MSNWSYTIKVDTNRCVISDIPERAYEYVVNGKPAIEWIIDQYQVKKDKKSGIVDDPNEFSNNPKYILRDRIKTCNVNFTFLLLFFTKLYAISTVFA